MSPTLAGKFFTTEPSRDTTNYTKSKRNTAEWLEYITCLTQASDALFRTLMVKDEEQ